MKKIRIEVTFRDGASYAWLEEPEEDIVWECGSWEEPFPNVAGNSMAFGIAESFRQSYRGAPLLDEHGKIIRIVVKGG